jgi:uncharacterized membrane protein YeaQ/YmgE (transglycosylase-associated protein family)
MSKPVEAHAPGGAREQTSILVDSERRFTMTLIQFLILLAISAVCGALGQSIAGYSVGGCLISAIVGFVGALIGMWLARQLGLPEVFVIRVGRETFPVLWSIIGSAILALLLGLVSRRRGYFG